MDITKRILTDKLYKDRIDQLDNETLRIIAEDHIKALEAAHKGIIQEEPERVDEVEYVQLIADSMQSLAKSKLKKVV